MAYNMQMISVAADDDLNAEVESFRIQNHICTKSEAGAELMRSKYCIRFELGLCPRFQGAKESGPLFLLNNGRRLALGFDCRACEMTVREA